MVQGNRQAVLVQPPQLLKCKLRLKPRVDEDQRDPAVPDDLINLGHRMLGRMPGPRHPALGQQHIDDGLGARWSANEVDGVRALSPLRGQGWEWGRRLRGSDLVIPPPDASLQGGGEHHLHPPMVPHPRLDHLGIVHRRAQPDPPHPWCQHLQPRQVQSQQIPAFGRVQGVNLVQDHAVQVFKE